MPRLLNYLLQAFIGVFMGTLASSALALGVPEEDCAIYFKTNYPMTEFRLTGSGTAIDTRTGLIWYRCSVGEFFHDGECRGVAKRFNWHQAAEAAGKFELAGYTDWRVPTVKELLSIVEKKCVNPSMNTFVFPTAQTEVYWTSEQNFFNKFLGWGVYMFNATDFGRHSKESEYLLLLVRNP